MGGSGEKGRKEEGGGKEGRSRGGRGRVWGRERISSRTNNAEINGKQTRIRQREVEGPTPKVTSGEESEFLFGNVFGRGGTVSSFSSAWSQRSLRPPWRSHEVPEPTQHPLGRGPRQNPHSPQRVQPPRAPQGPTITRRRGGVHCSAQHTQPRRSL